MSGNQNEIARIRGELSRAQSQEQVRLTVELIRALIPSLAFQVQASRFHWLTREETTGPWWPSTATLSR